MISFHVNCKFFAVVIKKSRKLTFGWVTKHLHTHTLCRQIFQSLSLSTIEHTGWRFHLLWSPCIHGRRTLRVDCAKRYQNGGQVHRVGHWVGRARDCTPSVYPIKNRAGYYARAFSRVQDVGKREGRACVCVCACNGKVSTCTRYRGDPRRWIAALLNCLNGYPDR